MHPRSARFISVLISSALLLPMSASFAAGSEIPEIPHGPKPGEIDSQNPNVEIPDPVLRAKVEEQLAFLTGHTPGEPITKTDLRRLPLLFVSSPGLTSLEGLQYATNLVALGIDNNNLTDLTPIKNLTKLQQLSLANTGLTNLEAITKLKSLSVLNVSKNKIIDFSALKNLPLLTSLDATGQNLVLPGTTAGIAYQLPVVKAVGGDDLPAIVSDNSDIGATIVADKIVWNAGGIGKISWNHTISPNFRISVTATQTVTAGYPPLDSHSGSEDPQELQAPSIAGVKTQSDGKSATVTWNVAPAQNQAIVFVLTYVEVANSKGKVKSGAKRQVAVNAKRLGYTLNKLKEGSTYRVYLRTRDGEGNVSPATSVDYIHPQKTEK